MAIVLEGSLDSHKWTSAAFGSLMMRLEVVVQMGAAGSQATGRSKAFLFTSVALLLHFRSIHVRMGCDQTCQKFGSQKKNGGGGGGGGVAHANK
mmetsp:Transcript_9073/g.20607  ORF Transcript_9073/g.20607 Transcript_9073/m.20607 type:complete len:94 (-) Transcript_9073:635-916(-)